MKKINVKGVIVNSDDQWIYDWFGIETTSPKNVSDQLAAAGGDSIEADINSGGGDVYAGFEIYTALKEYGNVTTKVVGIAASAASTIAMAGQKVLMSPTSNLMIHNAASVAQGDYRDMAHESGVLQTINQTITNAYALKSGMSQEDLQALMDQETWMTPQEALDKGFIDEIMFTDTRPQWAASAGVSQMLPKNVLDKVRSMRDKFSTPAAEPKAQDKEEPELKPVPIKQSIEGERHTVSLSYFERRLKNNEKRVIL